MRKCLPLVLIAVLISFLSYAGPYISANPIRMQNFSYTVGSGPSASQTLVVQSAIMGSSSGTVTVSESTSYELSLDNSSFSGSVSIPYSNDTLAATTVYVRLKAGLSMSANNYLGQIMITSPGISQTVMALGIVTLPCVITIDSLSSTYASFSWNATGAYGYECKIDQTSGDPTSGGTYASNATCWQASLSPNTSYYLHVRGVGIGGNLTGWTNKSFKTSSATSIFNHVNSSIAASLYPNPSRGSFTVSGTVENGNIRDLNVVVINALGQVVYSDLVKPEKESFRTVVQLQSAPGLYMIRVSAGEHCSTMCLTIAP